MFDGFESEALTSARWPVTNYWYFLQIYFCNRDTIYLNNTMTIICYDGDGNWFIFGETWWGRVWSGPSDIILLWPCACHHWSDQISWHQMIMWDGLESVWSTQICPGNWNWCPHIVSTWFLTDETQIFISEYFFAICLKIKHVQFGHLFLHLHFYYSNSNWNSWF